MRAVAACIAFVLVCGAGSSGRTQQPAAAAAAPQTPDWQRTAGESIAFEVATVKPSRPNAEASVNFILGPGDVYAHTGGRFDAKGLPLLDYIRFAYKLSDGQAGVLQQSAPAWVSSRAFDIQAKADLPDPTKDQMRVMMQALLASRFRMAVHWQTTELPVLALVVADKGKQGPQLHRHSLPQSCSNVVAPQDPAGPTQSQNVCGGLVSENVPDAPAHIRLAGRDVTLALLAAHLSQMGGFNRPVIDETGLSGRFDLTLEWGPDGPHPAEQDEPQVMLERALHEQLGLKLESRRASVPVLVLDRIDPQPSLD